MVAVSAACAVGGGKVGVGATVVGAGSVGGSGAGASLVQAAAQKIHEKA